MNAQYCRTSHSAGSAEYMRLKFLCFSQTDPSVLMVSFLEYGFRLGLIDMSKLGGESVCAYLPACIFTTILKMALVAGQLSSGRSTLPYFPVHVIE